MFRYSLRVLCSLALALTFFSALPVRAADMDKYLPADADVVVTINVRQLLDSGLIKKDALPQLKQAIENTPEMQEVLKAIGLDPLKDIEQVVVALPVGKDQVKGTVVIHGRFDKAKMQAAAEKAAKDHADSIKIHKEVADTAGGKHTVYEVTTPEMPQPIFVGVGDKGPVVIATGGEYVVEALSRGAAGKKAELKNKELQALLARIDPKQSLTITAPGAVLLKAIDDPQAKALLEKLEAINGGVTVADDVRLEILVSAKTAEGAKELSDSIKDNLNKGLGLLAILASDNKQLGPVIDLLKSVKTTSKDKMVTIKGEISAELIEQSMKKDK